MSEGYRRCLYVSCSAVLIMFYSSLYPLSMRRQAAAMSAEVGLERPGPVEDSDSVYSEIPTPAKVLPISPFAPRMPEASPYRAKDYMQSVTMAPASAGFDASAMAASERGKADIPIPEPSRTRANISLVRA